MTHAPVLAKLEALPFGEMPWEEFERIQWRILRDVEGLRHAQIYGERGQSQYGLDIVALAPDGSGVALQSKRYRRFGPSELTAAVKKFQTTKRPFAVNRLIIGVSRPVKSTAVVEKLAQLRRELAPLEVDLWDQQELSRLLYKSPEIVIQFFGQPTAEGFCAPFELTTQQVPPADAIAIREALARTPEVTTGAAKLLEEARITIDSPQHALKLVESAQALLRDAKFGGHAAQHDVERMRLLVELGRHDDAARDTLEDVWRALDQGMTTAAQIAQQRLHEIPQAAAHSARVAELQAVANAAINLYLNPLAYLPSPEELALGDGPDRVRLAILAGEFALADDNRRWLEDAVPVLRSLVATPGLDDVLTARLRLLLAETTDDWSSLLEDARKLRLGYEISGLVSARYARHCALTQRFEEAEALWDEATGAASVMGRWNDAERWTYSRRAFRARWRPFTSDELLPTQTALRELGPARPIITSDDDAYEQALEDLRRRKLRPAAISAQRALRDAVAASDWVAEERARGVLGEILRESDEPEEAARHLVRSGNTAGLTELAKSLPSTFVDVTADLSATNYWFVGSAYNFLAAQADLIPDDTIDVIASHITRDIAELEAGTLIDLRFVSTSRHGGALRALAGIAHRLSTEDATLALAYFTEQPPVEANQYRYHDADEATAVARIAMTQPTLRATAINHLVTLLARSETSRTPLTERAIHVHIDLAQPDLERTATQGNSWARETLVQHTPERIDIKAKEAALARLTSPLTHKAGVYSMGTNAIGDSLLVRSLTSAEVEPAVAELINRAMDPHIGSTDRGSYLLAAANLAPTLNKTQRKRHFKAALECAATPAQSEQDALEATMTHKLGSMRIVDPDQDSRDRAVCLAACLATTPAQRSAAKKEAFALIRAGREAGYWATKALQRLGDTLIDDVSFLAGQNWPLRSLAAITWASNGNPTYLGAQLADDGDVRVRRAFARSLATTDVAEFQVSARTRLAQDPCYSVRSALRGEYDGT